MTTEASRLHRRADPRSSKKAAQRIVASGEHQTQKSRVLAALAEHPGSTSAELAEHMRTDRYVVARRLPDLERDGVVERGPLRECKANRTEAVTWSRVKPVGVKALAQLDLFRRQS